MKNRLCMLLALLIANSCGDSRFTETRNYYNAEFLRKRSILKTLSPGDTTVADHVHGATSALVLMGKDTENGDASRQKSRLLYDSLCALHGMPRTDFPEPGPELDALETEIRYFENELAFIDRMILQRDTAGVFLFTAH